MQSNTVRQREEGASVIERFFLKLLAKELMQLLLKSLMQAPSTFYKVTVFLAIKSVNIVNFADLNLVLLLSSIPVYFHIHFNLKFISLLTKLCSFKVDDTRQFL